jgi:hypothetical protein
LPSASPATTAIVARESGGKFVIQLVPEIRAGATSACAERLVDGRAMNGVATAISILAPDPELY